MSENGKTVVRIRYERDGEKKVCYGEINESKLENFLAGEGNFISIENDGDIFWADKESLVSIEKLHAKSVILLKPRIIDYRTNANKDTGICP